MNALLGDLQDTADNSAKKLLDLANDVTERIRQIGMQVNLDKYGEEVNKVKEGAEEFFVAMVKARGIFVDFARADRAEPEA